MPFIKVNETGSFMPFRGATVIARIKKEDHSFWSDITKVLSECTNFSEYYAILPTDSYHMTVTNLFVEEDSGSEPWEKFIGDKKPFFQSLHQAIEEKLSAFEITLEDPYEYGALFLRVNLSSEIQKIIKEIAKAFNIQEKMPTSFHITLAYRYKASDLSNREMFRAMNASIKESIVHVIKSHKEPIILEAPELCFFDDMTKFTPWSDSDRAVPKVPAIRDTSFFEKKSPSLPKTSSDKKGPSCSIM